jgi:3-hydroxyacyl-[acyl-carrier-protein] dehydratase
MRWIWIDRFVEFHRGQSARAVKNLSRAEDYFRDHYPGYPVMPGSLILEGLAQTGGILVGEANDFREKVILAKIPSARFHGDAVPGDQLIYEATIQTLRAEGASVAGRVFRSMNGKEELLVEAEIFFAHLDQNRSKQMFGEQNFVFSGELKKILGLARHLAPKGQETSPK